MFAWLFYHTVTFLWLEIRGATSEKEEIPSIWDHGSGMPQRTAEEQQGNQKARHKYKDPNHSLGNDEEST